MKEVNLNKDFLTIGEFAEFVGIKESSLRHYSKKGIFCPAKRGDTPRNRYRYYSMLQITTVNMIRVLTGIGVGLDVIKALAKERTPEKIIRLLNQCDDKVAGDIRRLEEVCAIIRTTAELLNEGIIADETRITVSEMPEKRIILGETNDFTGENGFSREFLRFCNGTHNPQLNASFPICGCFKDMATFLKEPSKPTNFFSIDPKGYDRKPAGLYLIGYARGYYGQTGDLPQRMEAFAKENGLIFDGHVYNIYLSDEISEPDPNRYLLQASVPVLETRTLSFDCLR